MFFKPARPGDLTFLNDTTHINSFSRPFANIKTTVLKKALSAAEGVLSTVLQTSLVIVIYGENAVSTW